MRNEITLPKLAFPVSNQVFVEIQDTSFEFKTKSGIIAKSAFAEDAWSDSKGYSVSEFMPRFGTVVKLPRIITPYRYDFITDCEIEIGDEVFWPTIVLAGLDVLVVEGKKYLKIDYHQLIARRRNGDICPINGYVLFTPVPEVKTALAYTTTKAITDKWGIFKVPEKYPVSLMKKRNVPFIWNEGDRVHLMVHESLLKLESKLNNVLEEELYAGFWWMVLIDV